VPVLDASAAIENLIGSEAGARWRDIVLTGDESLCAPHLIDVEVLSGLRRLASAHAPLALRAAAALDDFRDLRLVRYGHHILLPRIWACVTTYPPMTRPMSPWPKCCACRS